MVIERIETPADVKALSRDELDVLAREIRDMLVVTCSRNGGHLAPNLGVVELTIALHRVLDLPGDKLVWDVSPPSVRPQDPERPRATASTPCAKAAASPVSRCAASRRTINSARVMPRRRSRPPTAWRLRAISRAASETIVAVLGDGALTGGLAYEALNNAGQLDSNFIVILNDNEMSIAPNVGSIASYLSVLRSKPFANFVRERAKDVFGHIPFGGAARKAFASAEMGAMRFVAPSEKTGGHLRRAGLPLHGPGRRPQHRHDDRCRSKPPRASTGRYCCTCARSRARATSRPRKIRGRSMASRVLSTSRTASSRSSPTRGRRSPTSLPAR